MTESIKNYIVAIRDHSLSMQGLRHKAGKDYNSLISGIKRDAIAYGFDTIVSVVECGRGRQGTVETVVENSSINALSPLHEGGYITDGGSTPLFDSVMRAIDICKRTPDFNDSKVAFLLSAITDGEENASRTTGAELAREIEHLQSTDRWTFTFRVPVGGYKKRLLSRLHIPEGNVAEWELTERGLERSTQEMASAFSSYYADLKTGKRSTGKFFTNLAKVTVSEVKQVLEDISTEVKVFVVTENHKYLANFKGKIEIQPFIEYVTGLPYNRGSVFYELMKPEKVVQGDKLIAIKHRQTGKVYAGSHARDILGLSGYNMSVTPGDHGDYSIFIQSKSVNRHIPIGTQLLHWPRFRNL